MNPNADAPQGDNANFISPSLEETPSVVPPSVIPHQEPQVTQAPPAEPVVPISPTPSDQPPAPPMPPINTPPGVPAQKSSPIFAIALTVLLVAIIGLAGYFLYTKYLGGASNKEAANTVITPAPVVVTPTPDPTADWKTYIGKDFQFKYPPEWLASENYDADYYKGQVITISDPTGAVSIAIKPFSAPYGFAGDQTKIENSINFTFIGRQYSATETTLDNKVAYVDQDVEVDNTKYNIIFGTGYPAGEDAKASLTEYQNKKNIILLILSNFKPSSLQLSNTESATRSSQNLLK